MQITASAPTSTTFQSAPDWIVPLLDELDLGITVLFKEAVVYLNRAARYAMKDDGPIVLRGSRVCARRDMDDAELKRALLEAERGRRTLIALGDGGSNGSIAIVPLPVVGDSNRPVLLLLGRRRLSQEYTTHWFAKLHGLSPAESTVLRQLLLGNDPRAIAHRQGVAMSTVRTHINSIRGKTSSRGMRDVLIAASTLPPIAPLVYADSH